MPTAPMIFFVAKGFNFGSCVTFSPRVPVVSFSLKQFIRLSLTSITVTLVKIKANCFYRLPLNLDLSGLFS